MVRCITNSMDMNLSKLWEMWETEEPGMLQSTASRRAEYDLVTEQQQQQQPQLYSGHIFQLLGMLWE